MKKNETKANDMTDVEVEIEIERIKGTEAYHLALKEQYFNHYRRQYLRSLRWLEKRGETLLREGKTFDDFSVKKRKTEEEEEDETC